MVALIKQWLAIFVQPPPSRQLPVTSYAPPVVLQAPISIQTLYIMALSISAQHVGLVTPLLAPISKELAPRWPVCVLMVTVVSITQQRVQFAQRASINPHSRTQFVLIVAPLNTVYPQDRLLTLLA